MPDAEGDGPVGFVSDEFNLGSTFGFTSGYPSVHLGHVIQQRNARGRANMARAHSSISGFTTR